MIVLSLLVACSTELAPFPTCQDEPDPTSVVGEPTWNGEIADLVHSQCAVCHDGVGLTPFPLRTHEEVLAQLDAVVDAALERRMPPPGPTSCGDCQTFTNARWLSTDELALLAAWEAAGSPLGDGEEPALPAPPPSLEAPDLTLDIGTDYTPVPADGGADDYRCFLVEPGLTADRFLVAHEVQPGNADIVHHVIAYQPVDDEAAQEARDLAAVGDGASFTCFGDAGVDASVMAAWAPGVGVTSYPEGTGLRVVAGRPLVVQVHYNTDGGSGSDRTALALSLRDTVDAEASIAGMGHDEFELEPAQEHVSSTHDHRQVAPGTGTLRVWGVLPHMHTLGLALNVQTSNRDGTTCLVDVPSWDFDWQGFYQYTEPVDVQGSDRITITCEWSTLGRDEVVTWGDGTEDEMCLNFFYVTEPEE